MYPPSALYQNERLSNPIHKARALAILHGFGSGLFAVLGTVTGVGEVGSGVGVILWTPTSTTLRPGMGCRCCTYLLVSGERLAS